ncbi:MAG: hypothetical protein K9M44_03670 [Candidatus Pacebacteria bacterium]|nr:hypothetical protein [Candidatus Paceibacterota bacterium]
MKTTDDKYFIHFPEFFNSKPWGVEVYASTSVEIMGIPKGVNIIFTESDNLEKITQEAKKDWEEMRDVEVPEHQKQACLNIARTLQHKQPQGPKLKILFKKGELGTCEMSDDEKTLSIFISGIKPPEKEKIWFYPADAFEI